MISRRRFDRSPAQHYSTHVTRTNSKDRCDGQELTRKAVGGSPDVLDELVRCFEAKLLEFGRRYCGSEEDAKDALQDAYEAATRHLKGFRGEASIKTWLTRLLISACSRRRRGAKNDPSRHRSLDLTPAQEARYLSANFPPEDELARRQLFDQLQRALMDLAETDRLVLLLRDGQQLTAPEAASLMGLTVPAIKSRLHRARKRIREAMVRFGEE